MIKFITFLTRRYLGLKKYEIFRFSNQKFKRDYYYFNNYGVVKVVGDKNYITPSNVSYNYLLNSKNMIVHDGAYDMRHLRGKKNELWKY